MYGYYTYILYVMHYRIFYKYIFKHYMYLRTFIYRKFAYNSCHAKIYKIFNVGCLLVIFIRRNKFRLRLSFP